MTEGIEALSSVEWEIRMSGAWMIHQSNGYGFDGANGGTVEIDL